MRLVSKIFLVYVFLLAFSLFVKADPIRITSGSSVVFNYGGSPSSDFNFSGQGIWGAGTHPFGSFSNTICQTNCNVVGTPVNLTSQFSSGNPSSSYIGRVEYLGNTFFIVQSNFAYVTDSAIVPPPTSFTDGSFTTARMSNTLTATFSLRSFSSTIPDTILRLTGNGFATIDYVYNPVNQKYDAGFIRYSFDNGEAQFTSFFTPSPTPEPTPEPATLLLLGTGLVGIFGYARRKRKTK